MRRNQNRPTLGLANRSMPAPKLPDRSYETLYPGQGGVAVPFEKCVDDAAMVKFKQVRDHRTA